MFTLLRTRATPHDHVREFACRHKTDVVPGMVLSGGSIEFLEGKFGGVCADTRINQAQTMAKSARRISMVGRVFDIIRTVYRLRRVIQAPLPFHRVGLLATASLWAGARLGVKTLKRTATTSNHGSKTLYLL